MASTLDQVAALRPDWEELPARSIETGIDHFMDVIRFGSGVIRPHVIRLCRDDGRSILAVARIEESPVEIRIGYRVIARPTVRRLILAFDGVLGAREEEDYLDIQRELVRPLIKKEAAALVLPAFACDDPLVEISARFSPRLRRNLVSEDTVKWTVRIPETFEAFLSAKSSKVRQGFRQIDRQVRKAYGDSVQTRSFREADALEELFSDLETVASKTYQRGLGAGFKNDQFHRAIAASAANHGAFGAWVTYLEGHPVSFWYGARYADVFVLDTTGFDPQYGKDRIGTFTMLRMIEDLCADPLVHGLDFGFGDAEYKRRVATDRYPRTTITIYAPTVRGTTLNLAASAAALVNSGARRIVSKSPTAQQFKQRWRRQFGRAPLSSRDAGTSATDN